jgi:hypothetical protein
MLLSGCVPAVCREDTTLVSGLGLGAASERQRIWPELLKLAGLYAANGVFQCNSRLAKSNKMLEKRLSTNRAGRISKRLTSRKSADSDFVISTVVEDPTPSLSCSSLLLIATRYQFVIAKSFTCRGGGARFGQ